MHGLRGGRLVADRTEHAVHYAGDDRSLKYDGPAFTTSDMQSTMPMHLQTAFKQRNRSNTANPRHVLLTFFNEKPWHAK